MRRVRVWHVVGFAPVLLPICPALALEIGPGSWYNDRYAGSVRGPRELEEAL